MFDDLHDNENESTDFVYEIHRKMVKEICDLGFMEFENITNILKAYKKDPKSIEGIVNKINKYK